MSTSQATVLVVGGAGFVGYHVVAYFVAHSIFAEVTVLSRSASSSRNRVPGANYLAGDLTKHDEIKYILDKIRPTIIVHAASPSPVTGTPKQYKAVNVLGTQNLLSIAKLSEYVRAFIFTSSSNVAQGREHLNLDESCALADTDPGASPYARSKAQAETMVLRANFPKASDGKSWAGHLSTASLRFPIIYGTHDDVGIPSCLRALSKGQTNATMGDATNLWSFCSTENMATSHALLASALLSPQNDQSVGGQAFNINDGDTQYFWSYAQAAWKFAGYSPDPQPRIMHIPVWFLLGLATFLEWVYWIFTLGQKRPFNLGKQQVEYMCFTHTYDIGKARRVLNYRPKADFDNGMEMGVRWCMEHAGWKEKLKGTKDVKLS